MQYNSFSYLYEYVMTKIPNSRIIVIGGSDEICKSVYDSKVFDHIIHMDQSIDAKPMYKLEIADGRFKYEPTYHEHHRSYLRQIFAEEKQPEESKSNAEGDKVAQGAVKGPEPGFKPLEQLIFFGI